MKYINKITNDAQQRLILTGIRGLQITLTMRFMPRIQRWIMGISYGDVSIQGIPVCTSLNLLRQYKNVLPFGISCATTNQLDPYTVDDFANQTANLYLLDETDVEQIEGAFFE